MRWMCVRPCVRIMRNLLDQACRSDATVSVEPKQAGTESSPSPRQPLLHIFDLGAIGLIVADKKGLKGRRKLLAVEVALLIRLHIRSAFPQTYCEPGILILRILQEPPPAKPLDVTPLCGHRGVIRFLKVLP